MQLPQSGLENHPTGTGNLNAILNANWAGIDNWFAPGYGLTASQTGTTVSASANVFLADDVGAIVRWADGTVATITAFTDAQTVTVGTSQTVASQSFIVYRTDQTPETASMRLLTRRLRPSSGDDGKVPRYNYTTKRFDLVTQTGYGTAAGRVLFGGGASTEATSSADLVYDDATNLLTLAGKLNLADTLYIDPTAQTASTSSTTLDGATSNVFDVTIAANTTITMSNVKTGGLYFIGVRENGTGGYTVAFNSIFKFPKSVAPEINTAAGAFTGILAFALSATELICIPAADYLLKTGGTMTGKITLDGDPTSALHAATKQYVDTAVTGLAVIKAAVAAATTAALAANTRTSNDLDASANGAFGTLDGVALTANATEASASRILVKDEATGANNGIYWLYDAGSAGTPWKLRRTTDADASAEVLTGMTTFVSAGTANANKEFVLITPPTITLNTTALSFSQRTAVIADGAVTDAKIGNRTADDTLATPADTGTLTQLISWITGRLKAITGESGWKDAPDISLASLFLRTLSDWSGASDNPVEHKGTHGSGAAPAYSGARSTMLWHPKKSAFRVGAAGGTEWNDANIGNYSFAANLSTTASADYTFAFGQNGQATARSAIAGGFYSIASGQYSIAFGYQAQATNEVAVSLSFGGIASGLYAAVLGGNGATAEGEAAATLGGSGGTFAQGYSQVVIGKFNVKQGTGASYVATDQVFIVGNGASAGARANAFALHWQGQLALTACSQHASPAAGHIWYDTTAMCLASYTTMGKLLQAGVAYASPDDSATISNTVTLTDFDNSFTVPASSFAAGKVLRVTARGKYSSDATTPGNVTFKIRKGSTTLLTTAATAMVASATNYGWKLDALISVRSVGGAGTVSVCGEFALDNGSAAAARIIPANGTVVWDTTAGATLQAAVEFSIADADNKATMEVFLVEVLG